MKSYIKTRTVQSIVRDIKKGKIILETGIQRKQDQWDRKKKSLLILSAIQEIIIPGIFAKETVNEKGETVWEILDGKRYLQRHHKRCDNACCQQLCTLRQSDHQRLAEVVENLLHKRGKAGEYQQNRHSHANDSGAKLN